jgi:hypothetical protein
MEPTGRGGQAAPTQSRSMRPPARHGTRGLPRMQSRHLCHRGDSFDAAARSRSREAELAEGITVKRMSCDWSRGARCAPRPAYGYPAGIVPWGLSPCITPGGAPSDWRRRLAKARVDHAPGSPEVGIWPRLAASVVPPSPSDQPVSIPSGPWNICLGRGARRATPAPLSACRHARVEQCRRRVDADDLGIRVFRRGVLARESGVPVGLLLGGERF